MTSLSTALFTSHELSVPAFLEFINGVEVRAENVIAKGGGGTISMGSILEPRLYKRTNRAECVLKQLNGDLDQLSQKLRNSFLQEIALMWLFRDDANFARVYGYAT